MDYPRLNAKLTGPLSLTDENGTHDLHQTPWPFSHGNVEVAAHDARVILLVEKSSIFDKIQQHNFAQKNRCILACGGGYPRRRFHQFLRRLTEELHLPLLVLADCDPAGFELFFLVTRGTTRSGSSPRKDLNIPDARYLGLRTRDREQLALPGECTIHLSIAERQQLDRLRACRWLQHTPGWHREIEALSSAGSKLEMEAAGWGGGEGHSYFSYFANVFLPTQLDDSGSRGLQLVK